jgi:hypothetical protein
MNPRSHEGRRAICEYGRGIARDRGNCLDARAGLAGWRRIALHRTHRASGEQAAQLAQALCGAGRCGWQ